MQYQNHLKKISNWLKNDGLALLIFLFIFGYTLFVFIIPFIQYNPITSWDMPGLYFSTWYEKEYLFPKIIGWNPFYFLGYPQHQFYPPLFAYTAAALAYLMPLMAAFKTVFILTLILLPLSFYYFARSFEFSRNASATIAFLMFSILFLFPTYYVGGNFTSTFHVGLISHVLGMVMFFFYAGSIQKSFLVYQHKKILLPSLLFALCILTHILAAFAGAFLLLAYAITHADKRKTWFWLIKHGLLTLLLSAFWVVPFIAKRSWLEAAPIGVTSSPFLFLITAILLLLLFFKKEEKAMPLVIFLVIVLLFSFFTTYIYPLPIHLYRFLMYMYLILPIAAATFLKKERMWILLFISLCALLIIHSDTIIYAYGEPKMVANSTLQINPELGRIFILTGTDTQTSPHVLKHQIVEDFRIQSLEGLYVESSKHSRYIFDFRDQIRSKNAISWGTLTDPELVTKNTTKLVKIIPAQGNLFHVKYILIPNDTNFTYGKKLQEISYTSKKINNETNWTYNYVLYELNNSDLIEVIPYAPRYVKGNWQNETLHWFLSENITKGILVEEPVPNYKGTGKESVKTEEISPTYEYIRFRVNDANSPVPVLIKISAFPNWHAYENGKPTKIYLASPNLMLVYAQGTVELKYQNTPIDTISNISSILGLVLVISMLLTPKTFSKVL